MNPFRIMPLLLISGEDCLKGEKFKNHQYIGDPINIVKIFNEKEVDEIIILDISSRSNDLINWNLIEKLSNECRMPFSYGGNVNNIEDVRKLNRLGVEKIIFTQSNLSDLKFIENAIKIFGSSTISFLLNIESSFFKKFQPMKNRTYNNKFSLTEIFNLINDLNFGEVIIQNVDSEGKRTGFNFDLLNLIDLINNKPIVLSGGINSYQECRELASYYNISGVAIGANFVFYGQNKAVLIDYFTKNQIIEIFNLRN